MKDVIKLQEILRGWHKAQLREVDYWITTNEKVGRERLVHEGKPDGQKTKYCR